MSTLYSNHVCFLLLQHSEFGFHVCGEGGEYETLVTDCPLFKKKIVMSANHMPVVLMKLFIIITGFLF